MKARYLNIPIKELQNRAKSALARLEKCDLCPNDCGVNRLEGQLGFCNAGATAKVASYNLHSGEEPAISGARGSGTIFFSNCTMKCAYCQNWPISHKGNGIEYDAAGLANVMLELQHRGAHNINFVTPTHYMPRILEALPIAMEGGFNIPIVYNTSGYEVLPALKLLRRHCGHIPPGHAVLPRRFREEVLESEDVLQRHITARRLKRCSGRWGF